MEGCVYIYAVCWGPAPLQASAPDDGDLSLTTMYIVLIVPARYIYSSALKFVLLMLSRLRGRRWGKWGGGGLVWDHGVSLDRGPRDMG